MSKGTKITFYSACGSRDDVTCFDEIVHSEDDPIIKRSRELVNKKYKDHCYKCKEANPVMTISEFNYDKEALAVDLALSNKVHVDKDWVFNCVRDQKDES